MVDARVIPDIAPGSPEWLGYMSASKVAAIVGLSSYESRYSLWQQMSGNLPPEPQTAIQARGHYLEPAIATWFGDQHPEYAVLPGSTWTRDDYPWMLASPDRVLCDADTRTGRVEALLEVKTAADDFEWGRPGTAEIPASYRPQVVWQMAVTGARLVFVAVLTSRLEFREYVVEWDDEVAADAAWLIDQADAFMDSLVFGEVPDLDEHKATYEAVKRLHPKITDEEVEVPLDVAAEYLTAKHAETAAKARAKKATTVLADAMGNAKTARCNDVYIAGRQASSGGTPFVKAPPKLADPARLTEEEESTAA